MAESREGNPVTNFKKTEMAQQKRVEAAQTSTGFMDRLKGSSVFGYVESKYEEGFGGSVKTDIRSGGAELSQTWNFDKNGDVTDVWVRKNYGGSSVKSEHLKRGDNGKFIVVNSKSLGIYSGSWDREFNTVRKRTQSPKR